MAGARHPAATCRGHIYWRRLDREADEFALLPNFRLPTLIHTRSPTSSGCTRSRTRTRCGWPPGRRQAYGCRDGRPGEVRTRIGHFVKRVWVTEGIRPGVVACPTTLAAGGCTRTAGLDRWSSASCASRSHDDGDARSTRFTARGRSRATTPTAAGLVERRRRAPEPDLPGAAGPDQRHALLAPEGARRTRRDRTIATATSRLTPPVAPHLPGMARGNTAGARARRPAPPLVARPPAQAGGAGVPLREAMNSHRTILAAVVVTAVLHLLLWMAGARGWVSSGFAAAAILAAAWGLILAVALLSSRRIDTLEGELKSRQDQHRPRSTRSSRSPRCTRCCSRWAGRRTSAWRSTGARGTSAGWRRATGSVSR